MDLTHWDMQQANTAQPVLSKYLEILIKNVLALLQVHFNLHVFAFFRK